MNRAAIHEELIRSGKFQSPVTLAPMLGGAINKSFKLTSKDKPFFLKTFELNHILPIDRDGLFTQQQQLAELGVAAQPLYLSKNHEFQVEAWVEHTPLSRASWPIEEKLKHMAKVLWQIHQLPTVAAPIDLPKNWLVYLQSVDSPDYAHWQRRINKYQKIWLDTRREHQVLCHNDLAFAHMSISTPYLVFDWEYAAQGNRFFDIAASIIINKLDVNAAQTLYQYYAEQADMSYEVVFEQSQQQLPLVTLTNDLWYLAANSLEKPLT